MVMLTRASDDERWLDVPGYEGAYQISDRGRVRSLDRWINGTAAGRMVRKLRRGKPLKPSITSAGYYHFMPCQDGVKRAYRVHQLVCRLFNGPPPESEEHICVAHNDGNKLNNHADNLRWATYSENQQDRKIHEDQIITSNKITNEQALEIIARLNRGDRQKDIIADTGLGKGIVGNIALKRSWKHLSHLLHR